MTKEKANNITKNANNVKIDDQAVQMYLDLGLGFDEAPRKKRDRSALQFKGTGVGFTRNILNRKIANKEYQKGGLGGAIMAKRGKGLVNIFLDEETIMKFRADCKLRKQPHIFRLASIVTARYPSYFNTGIKASQVNIVSTGQHAHTDFLKRGTVWGSNIPRKIMGIYFSGIYATKFYDGLVRICLDNNMSMSCFLGSLLEIEYKNFNIPQRLPRTFVELEAAQLANVDPWLQKKFQRSLNKALSSGSVINTREKSEVTFARKIRKNAIRVHKAIQAMGLNPDHIEYVQKDSRLEPKAIAVA